MWEKYRALLGVIVVVAGGILWFTPMSYSEETRQIVEGIRLEIQLDAAKESMWYYKKNCTDLKTKEWLCSQDDLEDYEKILLDIRLLEKKLGIGGEENENP